VKVAQHQVAKPPCSECRSARILTWLGMCTTCTLAEVERRLAETRRAKGPR
jgi:hypothetical protein